MIIPKDWKDKIVPVATYKSKLRNEPAPRKKPSHPESDLQIACVEWFRYQYPKLTLRLFSIPNGGTRQMKTIISKGVAKKIPLEAMTMKKEGLTAGVSDLCLAIPNRLYHGLYIEMKSKAGTLSPEQKEWIEDTTKHGYRCVVCRTSEQFKIEVNEYLGQR